MDHVREYGGTTMRVERRAEMVGLTPATFGRELNRLQTKGMLKLRRTMKGNLIEIFTGNEPEPQRAERIQCPRCATVNCTRHTATTLTTGRISPVYARRI